MRRSRRHRPVLVALYLNAALVAVLIVVLLSRSGTPAMAAPQMAGGSGVYMTPAQFSVNTWGCYLMDIENQTLCAYQFFPTQGLRMVAARQYRYDLQLKRVNTSPDPDEIQEWVARAKGPVRGRPLPPGRPETQPGDMDPSLVPRDEAHPDAPGNPGTAPTEKPASPPELESGVIPKP